MSRCTLLPVALGAPSKNNANISHILLQQISHIFFFLHCIGKDEVTGSNPVISSRKSPLQMLCKGDFLYAGKLARLTTG